MGRRTKNNKEDETKQKRGKGLSGKKQKEYEDPNMSEFNIKNYMSKCVHFKK